MQPLHAVVKSGKNARVSVALSQSFNDCLPDVHFRMYTVQEAVDMSLVLKAQSGQSAGYVKLDIASCFLSFPIQQDDLHLFYCKVGGNRYQFLASLFGWMDAPRVASLLLDVVSSSVADAGCGS